MKHSYKINTLHRAKYMLSFFALMILSAALTSIIEASEIVKIVFILFSIPVILFLSIKWSKNYSEWNLSEQQLEIKFNSRTFRFPFSDIDHIKSLTRSGGNLLVIHIKHKRPKRFWRNKLFTSDDDIAQLHDDLLQKVEFYKV